MTKDIILFSGGAAHGIVSKLLPDFQSETGNIVQGTFGAVGAMLERARSGERVDMLILTRPIIDALVQSGEVLADSVQDLGMVRTAIAVRTGDAAPDVSTPDALKAALLAADEIYFPDPALATAGIHFAKVMDSLGITAQKAAAFRPHPNGATAMRALAASAARAPIGCTQVTEIIITQGASLIAPLPDDLGLATIYTAAVMRDAENAAAAAAFIAKLCAADAAQLRQDAGFE